MRRVFDFTQAIVRAPAPSVTEGLRSGADAPRYPDLLDEHRAYVAALEAAGLAVEALPALHDYPDSLYVEDPAFVLPEGAIVMRPGAPSRQGEAAHIAPTLRRRFAQVLVLENGMADGGDILTLPNEVLIGLSARTDRAGAQRFCELVASLGRPARIVETPPGTLHLKTACALLDEDTVLATPELAAGGIFGRMAVLETPEGEEQAANLLRLNETFLVGADYPRTLDLLSGRGPKLVALPVAENRKIDAGLSCLSLRW